MDTATIASLTLAQPPHPHPPQKLPTMWAFVISPHQFLPLVSTPCPRRCGGTPHSDAKCALLHLFLPKFTCCLILVDHNWSDSDGRNSSLRCSSNQHPNAGHHPWREEDLADNNIQGMQMRSNISTSMPPSSNLFSKPQLVGSLPLILAHLPQSFSSLLHIIVLQDCLSSMRLNYAIIIILFSLFSLTRFTPTHNMLVLSEKTSSL
jgi:hypothetical protein